MAAARPSKTAKVPSDEETRVVSVVDRTKRIASMLDRWEAEDVSDEPDWDVDEVGRIQLRPTKA
ncbi:hypothetical protein LVJ94_42165 [Pendulispora rubella]|uniref:Uncharacterized protein n=1 Tax=Pendulispora rubella TaxID=2741070 RepID=A0ABZ2KYC2_9BACT